MAEHEWEKWEKGEPVWYYGGPWLEATIERVRVNMVDVRVVDGAWALHRYVPSWAVKPRDPALDGADIPTVEPTAESEAKR